MSLKPDDEKTYSHGKEMGPGGGEIGEEGKIGFNPRKDQAESPCPHGEDHHEGELAVGVENGIGRKKSKVNS